jgi:hypothetical protein
MQEIRRKIRKNLITVGGRDSGQQFNAEEGKNPDQNVTLKPKGTVVAPVSTPMFKPAFRSLQLGIMATVVLVASPLCSQTAQVVQPAFGGEPEVVNAEDRMITPAPVSGGGYSLAFAQESARENYLRGGFTFSTAYDDNILPSSSGRGVSDTSYSVRPWITLNQSRPRFRWDVSYTPGFTFYQSTTSLNQADHNLGVDLEYRAGPKRWNRAGSGV